MKHIITLLFGLGAVASSFAQSRTTDRAKEVITKQPRTTGSYPNDRRVGDETSTRYPTSTSREAEISQINRRYDAKIQAVRANPILSAEAKERRIHELEYERAQKIREINNRYSGSDDNTYSKNKNKGQGKGYGKNNNPGKHLGWEKGKGNPHRTGGAVKGKSKNK
jgi:hypothetical protein